MAPAGSVGTTGGNQGTGALIHNQLVRRMIRVRLLTSEPYAFRNQITMWANGDMGTLLGGLVYE
jgi:hypothetical protein